MPDSPNENEILLEDGTGYLLDESTGAELLLEVQPEPESAPVTPVALAGGGGRWRQRFSAFWRAHHVHPPIEVIPGKCWLASTNYLSMAIEETEATAVIRLTPGFLGRRRGVTTYNIAFKYGASLSKARLNRIVRLVFRLVRQGGHVLLAATSGSPQGDLVAAMVREAATPWA